MGKLGIRGVVRSWFPGMPIAAGASRSAYVRFHAWEAKLEPIVLGSLAALEQVGFTIAIGLFLTADHGLQA